LMDGKNIPAKSLGNKMGLNSVCLGALREGNVES
jgi:hypothetical protein